MIAQRATREHTPKPSVLPLRILASIASLGKKELKKVHQMRKRVRIVGLKNIVVFWMMLPRV
jgi:hypothetical protein